MFNWCVTFRIITVALGRTMAIMRPIVFALLLIASVNCEEDAGRTSSETATEVVVSIFDACLQYGSLSCVKPKVLRFLRSAIRKDEIDLTENLSIVKSAGDSWDEQSLGDMDLPKDEAEREKTLRYILLERIDNFLNSHQLKVKVPREITSGEMLSFVPEYLIGQIPNELTVPLSDTTNSVQARGFMKKVMIPFLLGLKFKATLFIPLAIALIALKTWKALTLGLLSLVLSGAMVIFKFTKPKVVNYEVYHYPSHHSGPIVDHPSPYGEHHGYGRSDAQNLAYRGYLN